MEQGRSYRRRRIERHAAACRRNHRHKGVGRLPAAEPAHERRRRGHDEAAVPARTGRTQQPRREIRTRRHLHLHSFHPHCSKPVPTAAAPVRQPHDAAVQGRAVWRAVAARLRRGRRRVQERGHRRGEETAERSRQRRERCGKDGDDETDHELSSLYGRARTRSCRGRRREAGPAKSAGKQPHPGSVWECQDGAQRQQLAIWKVCRNHVRRQRVHLRRRDPNIPSREVACHRHQRPGAVVPRVLPRGCWRRCR
mmetsp:Transcript_3431/g.9247  ORF Transcript_3431/g.9247 Transcript_3431/m.9247 type:complete len:253 (-) Transcript_3431:221-979(-)